MVARVLLFAAVAFVVVGVGGYLLMTRTQTGTLPAAAGAVMLMGSPIVALVVAAVIAIRAIRAGQHVAPRRASRIGGRQIAATSGPADRRRR